MKKIALFLIASLFVVSNVRAQTPVISYQGMIATAAGVPLDTSACWISVALYADEAGTQAVWRDTYQTAVIRGVFSIGLGNHAPLPAAALLDKPLWIGVAINGSPEMRPLTRMSAVPMAMNVADSSITSSKLATDYVSSISINGQKISGRGSALNLMSTGGVAFGYDSNAHSIYAVTPTPSIPNSGVYWSESGNYATVPGTNYVGTSDSVAFEIHVNHSGDTTLGNERVMRFEPAGIYSSPNIIAGSRYNHIFIDTFTHKPTFGAVIGGGGGWGNPNVVFDSFPTVAGGYANSASLGSFVGGGSLNQADNFSTVGGGQYNTADWENSTVGGGLHNHAESETAFVGGGEYNTAGGTANAIAGGSGNYAQSTMTVIGGGLSNHTEGDYSTIAGGRLNTAGTYSAIAGGIGLTLGINSFGFNTALSAVVPQQNVAFFGGVDLWIGNTDTVARSLKLFGPNGDDSFWTARYVGIKAPLPDSSYTLTMPKNAGNNGEALVTNGSAGILSWGDAGSIGGWTTSGNFNTHPPTNFLGTKDSNSFEIHLFDTSSGGNKRVMRYEINDTSANLIGGYHDNAVVGTHLVGVTIGGGGSSGLPNVVKGSYGTIAGGQGNTDTTLAFVGGGDSNTAFGIRSVIVGGSANHILGGGSLLQKGSNTFIGAGRGNVIDTIGEDHPPNSTAIVAGTNNHATDENAFIGAGESNNIVEDNSFIGAGGNDSISEISSAIVAGTHNTIAGGSDGSSFIGAGTSDSISSNYSVIGGGRQNAVTSDYGVITGGSQDTIGMLSSSSAIAGGDHNVIDSASNSSIGGGQYNRIVRNSHGSISYATIPGGSHLIASSYGQTVVGLYNRPQGSSTFTTRIPNDRLFIVGGGQDSIGHIAPLHDTTIPVYTNAFEVTNLGASIVYQNNGTSVFPTGDSIPSPNDTGAIYGARYQNNTCIAWADFFGFSIGDKPWVPSPGQDTVFSSFGVAKIKYDHIGHYTVTLNTVDSYTGARITNFNGVSITATPFGPLASTPGLFYVAIAKDPGSNVFDIWVTDIVTRSPVDCGVDFHVFARR